MKQFLLSLMCLLAITATASAEERSWSFKTSQTVPNCSNGATTNLNNADNTSVGTWDFTCTTGSAQGDKTNGPRYGAAKSPVSKGATLVLKDSDIPATATINEVTFTVKGNAKASGSKWNLKVGNRGGQNTTLEFSGIDSQNLTWSNVNLVGNDIVIELAENSTGGGFHLQGVKINYTETTGPIECGAPTFNVEDGANVYPGQEITATCSTPGATVKLFVHNATIGDTYTVSESDLNTQLTVKATASVEGDDNYLPSEAEITVNVVEKPEPVCAEPTFNVEDGASVYPGQEITATCETDGSTLTLTLNGNPVPGNTYTVQDSDINKELNFTATASIQGNKGPVTSSKSITVNAVEKPVVLTDELTPTVINISGPTYKLYEYKSTATKVEYYAKVALENDAFHINTTATSGGVNSGIVSKANVNNLVIDNIVVTVPDGTPVMKMSNSPGTKTGDVGGTAKTVEVNAAEDAVEITGTSKTEGTNTVYTYTPSNDYKYFALTTSKNSHFSSVVITYKKATAPTPTAVTVAFEGNVAEYTVGQEGVSVGYTVTPAEAAQYVDFTSSDPEAVTLSKNEENNALSLSFLKAAENLTVNASFAEGHDDEYTFSPASFSFKVNEETVEIKEPGQVTASPAPDEDGILELKRGDRITFSSENAARLKFEITYEDASGDNSASVIDFEVDAPYIYTVTADADEIKVTPVDADGKEYADKAFTGMIIIDSTPVRETTITFDYTKGSLIDENYTSTNSYVFTRSQGAGLFEATFNYVNEDGTDGSISYSDGGWKFSTENGAEYSVLIYTNPDFEGMYQINRIAFHFDTTDTLGDVAVSGPDGSDLADNIWSGTGIESAQFSWLSFDNFILSGIDVTFEHDEIEAPKIYAENGKAAISHSKSDHKIYYRIINKSDSEVTRAPGEGETYNVYTEPLTVKAGDIVYAYAEHPHGMTSDNSVFDVDTYILTGVDGIEDAAEENAEWFTLDGIRVEAPVKGMYIRVINGNARKIIL